MQEMAFPLTMPNYQLWTKNCHQIQKFQVATYETFNPMKNKNPAILKDQEWCTCHEITAQSLEKKWGKNKRIKYCFSSIINKYIKWISTSNEDSHSKNIKLITSFINHYCQWNYQTQIF